MSLVVASPSDSTPLTGPSASPLRELLGLALPTVLQMASYTAMQFIDTWLLARAVGSVAPVAATNAGTIAFSFISLGFGLLLVVNTLVSQAFGAGHFSRCGTFLWQGVWFAVGYSLLLAPIAWVIPGAFEWFRHSPQMVEMESIYVRIMLSTVVFKLVHTAVGQFLLATDRPNLVLLSSIIGVAVNVVVAYAMLFGRLGIEKPMGIYGAAWAQVIGTAVEMAAVIVFALWDREKRIRFNVLDWRLRWREMRSLLRYGFGSGVQFCAEVTAWSLFANWVFGALGQIAMEANTYMLRYITITFMPAMGISSAVTALVGRYIGMGRADLAIRRAHLGFVVALVYLILCGGVYLVFRRELIGVFTTDELVLQQGAILMIFAACYELFDGMYIVYYGALRGAGDTFVPAVATAVLCWTIMLFGGYVVATVFPEWSVAGPWGIASVYGVALGLFMLVRFQRQRWRTIRVEPHSNGGDVSDRFAQLQTTNPT